MPWILVRPILAGLCTLNDLSTIYSYNDLLDLHEVLDLKDYINIEQGKAAAQERKKNGY